MVLDTKGVVEAFTNDPITPNAADIYLENFGNGAMFRTGTYIALTIVADIFIVYRVYAVSGGSFIVTALPFILAIADIVTGALLIQAIRELAAGSSPDGKNVSTHAVVFYAFTLTLNVLCTPAIYSACLVAMIVPTVLGNNIQYCLLSVMPGIVGIAFSLIIVRIGSGLSPHSSAGPASGLRFASRRTGTQFDTTDDARRTRSSADDSDDIPVHLSHGSHSNETGSNSDRTKNEQ
ncbi:hypothetical protein B0H13DRAFT_2505688 [Mycena leptocephala]|nr:hypothetical protein B0H13DRAFT_2505688 [Mycena leptocephala]